ncbi:helix-turn-helix domain-containing protein [Pseudonocardia sp. KRD291]|uniref:helix-turn-helix domain-containing protein n=1 Tax=Pseudonocardia sp. KRD291 TaxID=2792007 RepID=UPI0035B3737B
MAARTGLARSTIGRIESGKLVPSLNVVSRLLLEADLELVAVDRDGRVVVPMQDPPDDDLRDGRASGTRHTWTRSSTRDRTTGGGRSTGWPARPRHAIGTRRSGMSSGRGASGRCGSPSSGTSRPRPPSSSGCGGVAGDGAGGAPGRVRRPRSR